jgi:membrane fusion protein, multidrug efflux system
MFAFGCCAVNTDTDQPCRMTSTISPRLPLPVSGLFIATLFAACGEKSAPLAIHPEVSVVQAAQMNVPVYSEFVGQTYGQEDIQLIPRLEGWITGIHFKEGAAVKKGQLLYTIDDLPTRSRVDAAAGQVARARTMVANKKADLDRVVPLAAMNALSKRDLDAAQAAYDAALAELQVAQAGLETAHIELGYAKITSPIDGIIGISTVMVGDYVGKGKLGGAINTVSSLGDMRVRFPVSETDLLAFQRRTKADTALRSNGQEVALLLSDGSAYSQPGRIDLADRSVDPTTGSVLIQAVFPNDTRILRPGQSVKVRIRTDQVNNAVMVPQRAVNQLQNLFSVFVLNDSNMVKMTPVKVGQRVGENWVIAEGVKPGQRVALIGNALIDPKVAVIPKPLEWDYAKSAGH